jgi:hypothetical protein
VGALIFGIRQNEVKAKGDPNINRSKTDDNVSRRKSMPSDGGAVFPIHEAQTP